MHTTSPLEFDIFNITLITPALLSGANPREADPNGLRGSSLRGMWRFWARAMWKGLKDDLTVKQMKDLEAGLFGDTDNRSFRMVIKNITHYKPADEYCLPHAIDRKFGKVQGLPAGSEYEIRIGWHPGTSDIKKKALASIIVSWSVLGSIGQRSRRGFGSVRLDSGTTVFNLNKLFENTVENYPQNFNSEKNLSEFVKKIIIGTAIHQSNYMNIYSIYGENNFSKDINRHDFKDMFTLGFLSQIAVGKKLGKNLYDHEPQRRMPDTTGPITRMHGRSDADKNEHGFSEREKRLASPIYLRFHKVEDEYVPLSVLSRRYSKVFSESFKNWLIDLGLQSLGTGEDPYALGASYPISRSTVTKLNEENQAWDIPSDKLIQKPKLSKQPAMPVWEKFRDTTKLQCLIRDIRLTEGIDDLIPDINTYKKTGCISTVPKFERPNQMNFTCGAADGQVNIELKLTCTNEEQWYFVRREIGKLIMPEHIKI